MSKAISNRNEEIYFAAVERKQSYNEIAEEWGLTRQRVGAIVQMKERELSGQSKQGELIDRIVFAGIQDWLVRHNMTVREFCEFSGYGSTNTSGVMRRFLYGETGGNIKIIKDILRVSGMTFEQAFIDIDNDTTADINNILNNKKETYIDIKQLGFDLKKERERRGLNQRMVAKRLGVSLQAYYRWEQGLTKQIKAENYNRLLEIFSSEIVLQTEEIEKIKEDKVSIRNVHSRDKYRNLNDLGINLFEERINHGWSQREVAEKLGVSILSYCRWETGKTINISHKNYKAIQRVFLNIK